MAGRDFSSDGQPRARAVTGPTMRDALTMTLFRPTALVRSSGPTISTAKLYRERLSLVGDVERLAVGLRVDGNGLDAQLAGRADDAQRDFPAVGNEDLLEQDTISRESGVRSRALEAVRRGT